MELFREFSKYLQKIYSVKRLLIEEKFSKRVGFFTKNCLDNMDLQPYGKDYMRKLYSKHLADRLLTVCTHQLLLNTFGISPVRSFIFCRCIHGFMPDTFVKQKGENYQVYKVCSPNEYHVISNCVNNIHSATITKTTSGEGATQRSGV